MKNHKVLIDVDRYVELLIHESFLLNEIALDRALMCKKQEKKNIQGKEEK